MYRVVNSNPAQPEPCSGYRPC